MQGKKRKYEDGEEDPSIEQSSSKRRKSVEDVGDDEDAAAMENHANNDTIDGAYPPKERPFFGLLDEEEQEHFRNAADMLEANNFESLEERDQFLTSLFREAEGKELKIAQSQSASRLLERLMQLSTAAQLKKLFQTFSGK